MNILDKIQVYGGFFKMNSLKIKNRNGQIVSREQVELHDAVAALVYNKENDSFIFVNQFRVGPEDFITEVPAGKMDIEGESPEETAKREIVEEIGYKVDEIELLHSYYPSPGSSTEKMYIFYAEVSEKISDGGGVETEDIKIIEIPASEVYQKFNSREFIDGKTIIAIQNWLNKKELQFI